MILFFTTNETSCTVFPSSVIVNRYAPSVAVILSSTINGSASTIGFSISLNLYFGLNTSSILYVPTSKPWITPGFSSDTNT